MGVQVLSSVQIGVSSKTRDQHWAGNVDSNSTIPTNIAEEWNGKSFEAHNLRDSGFDSHLRYKEFSQASYESNVTEQINMGMWMNCEVAFHFRKEMLVQGQPSPQERIATAS